MAAILRLVMGVLFFLVGLTGLIVPVLPGRMFLLLSVALFFPNQPSTEWTLRKVEPHLPRVVAKLRGWGIGQKQERRTENAERRI